MDRALNHSGEWFQNNVVSVTRFIGFVWTENRFVWKNMLFQECLDLCGCGLNLLHLSIFTFNYTTHAILTQVVFTFWAMPWEMIQWIIMNRTTVITSPSPIELRIHIMRVSFVKWMRVKWCVLWFKAFLTDIKFTFFTMPRESKRVQMAVS